MNYFLVDYENVNVAGLEGIENISENDAVIIFYSEKANTLTFDMHEKINNSSASFKFQKVVVKEKNALDFQLCSYLGFWIRDTITEENLNNYFIVSNDNGYSVLPDYWKNFGAEVKLVINLSKNEIKTLAEKIIDLEDELSKIFQNDSEVKKIADIINNSKTKTEVNNHLGKMFDSQKGGEIYRAIKSLLKDKL